jgi:hypothetical protein
MTPCRLFQQVGTSEIADKDEIAGHHADGLIGATAVIHDGVAHVLGRMSRGVQYREPDIAHAELVAVMHQMMRIRGAQQPLIPPVGSAFIAGVDGHAAFGKFAQPGHIVGVNVCIRGGDDPQLVARGDLVVAIDVAFGIEHDRIARARAADQVGVLGE